MKKTEKQFKTIEDVLKSNLTKSNKMTTLYVDFELNIKDIKDLLDVRYQFVYNVVSNYCNLNDVELRSAKKENKKDDIIKLYTENKYSIKEIAALTKSHYNHTRLVIREHESLTELEKI